MRGTLLGVPVRRTIVYWGLYSGPPILGKFPYVLGGCVWICKIRDSFLHSLIRTS